MDKLNTELAAPEMMILMGSEFPMYGTIDKPLFLAADVADMIEYAEGKAHQMLDLVDDDEKLLDTVYRAGQDREMWFLTENGLYEVLMQSRKPLAKRFKAEIKKVLHMVRCGELKSNRLISGSGNKLVIENAHILFRNFSGAEGKFNRAGDRNFCVVIENEKQAMDLMEDGWSVKTLKPREEGDQPRYYIPVTVRYDNFPPKVFMVTRKAKVLLNESTVGNLDYAELTNVDLTVTGSHWEVNGNSGTKAYLKDMYATIEEDVLAEKYAHEEYPTE